MTKNRNYALSTLLRILIALLAILPMILFLVSPVLADDAPDPIPPTLTPTNQATPTQTLYPCPVATYDGSKQVSWDYAMQCGHCVPTATPEPSFLNAVTIPTADMELFATPTADGFGGGGGPGDIIATPGGPTITPGGPTITPGSTITPSGPAWFVTESWYTNVYSGEWHRFLNICGEGNTPKATMFYHEINSTERFVSMSGAYGSGKPEGWMISWNNGEANILGSGGGTFSEIYEFFRVTGLSSGIYLPNPQPEFVWTVPTMNNPTGAVMNYQDFGGNMYTLCYGDNPPQPEPTTTPTPTITPEPGICAEYGYQDYDPAAGWGGYVITEDFGCTTLIPKINLPLDVVDWVIDQPFDFDFDGVRVCYNVVTFGDVEMMGVTFPIELLALPFVAFLINIIMKL